jgi:hypothetical protein
MGGFHYVQMTVLWRGRRGRRGVRSKGRIREAAASYLRVVFLVSRCCAFTVFGRSPSMSLSAYLPAFSLYKPIHHVLPWRGTHNVRPVRFICVCTRLFVLYGSCHPLWLTFSHRLMSWGCALATCVGQLCTHLCLHLRPRLFQNEQRVVLARRLGLRHGPMLQLFLQ